MSHSAAQQRRDGDFNTRIDLSSELNEYYLVNTEEIANTKGRIHLLSPDTIKAGEHSVVWINV